MKYDQQLSLPLYGPSEVDIDKRRDDKKDIQYIGKAILQGDGKYRCLADVSGMLCVVVVNLTFEKEHPNG